MKMARKNLTKEQKAFLEKILDISIPDGERTRQISSALAEIEGFEFKIGLMSVKNSIKNMEEKVNSMYKAVYGNGHKGLMDRVTQIESGIKIAYVAIIVLVAIMGVLFPMILGG
jgi:peptidoglycan hydrolase CwlO-like protein